jgi:hypothetical protein
VPPTEELDSENEMVVVLVERGARLPGCLEQLRRLTPNVFLAAQGATESTGDFATRAKTRLKRLASEGVVFRAALVSVARGGVGDWRRRWGGTLVLLGALGWSQKTPVHVFVDGIPRRPSASSDLAPLDANPCGASEDEPDCDSALPIAAE